MRSSMFTAMLAGVAALPALAEPSKEAKAFGAREMIQGISLSPDGTKVAIIKPDRGRGDALTIANFATGGSAEILHASGDPDRLSYCRWTTVNRLVCGIRILSTATGQMLGFTRLIAVDADGKNLKMLTQTPSSQAIYIQQYGGDVIDLTGDGKGGSVLMMRSYIPEISVGTRFANSKEGNGVDQVDTVSLKRRAVEQPKLNAAEFITMESATCGYWGCSATDRAAIWEIASPTAIASATRAIGSRWEPTRSV